MLLLWAWLFVLIQLNTLDKYSNNIFIVNVHAILLNVCLNHLNVTLNVPTYYNEQKQNFISPWLYQEIKRADTSIRTSYL